jgi:hypothetical protein
MNIKNVEWLNGSLKASSLRVRQKRRASGLSRSSEKGMVAVRTTAKKFLADKQATEKTGPSEKRDRAAAVR